VSVHTIGHSTRSIEEFIALLTENAVTHLMDVRAIPRSRTVPQFNGDALAASLTAEGITYTHVPELGGRRHHKKGAPPSHNTYWRIEAFRNYADHAETAEFAAAIDALVAVAESEVCAVMCAEAVWWRCHRRIIADYLLARGVRVVHIMGPGKVEDATLTPGAEVLAGGTIRYVKEPQPGDKLSA